MRERRWIVLIKIITQRNSGHTEKHTNKAEMACLYSLYRILSSNFCMSSLFFMSFYSSLASCTSLPELVFDIQRPPFFSPFWIIEIHLFFSNHMRNPESFLTQSLKRIRLSNLWKCKHCGWSIGVLGALSWGSLIVLCHCLNWRWT